MLQISPARFRSILILQTKFIGDIVFASALAENLRLEYPDARIVFLCEARFASFVTRPHRLGCGNLQAFPHARQPAGARKRTLRDGAGAAPVSL